MKCRYSHFEIASFRKDGVQDHKQDANVSIEKIQGYREAPSIMLILKVLNF